EVPHVRLAEDFRGPVDRPALDEPGRVERSRRASVEVAACLLAQLLAAVEDPADVAVRVLERELVAHEPADLAVRLARTEARVDPAEPVEHLVERRLVGVVVADVDHDRHAHHVLDATNAGQDVGEHAHAFFALRIADWSDCANASLESVAPETMLMLALCARSASLFRIGSACELM